MAHQDESQHPQTFGQMTGQMGVVIAERQDFEGYQRKVRGRNGLGKMTTFSEGREFPITSPDKALRF